MEPSTNTLLFVALLCLFVAGYKWATKNNDYFKRKGIKSTKPAFLIGNSGNLFTQKMALNDLLVYFYQQFPDEKIYGTFQFRSPLLVLRDPDLIKQVGIKQFDNFMEHRVFIDETMDPLLGNALVSLTGDKWRDMRATLSPVFTGSKMRHMFELVTKCGEQMVATFQNDAKSQGSSPLNHDMKDLFSRFTIDVVATTAFGIEVNSFEDKENLFFTLGKEMLNFKSLKSAFKLMGFFVAPWLLRRLDISLLDRKVSEYFTEVIRRNFYSREQNKIERNDVIHLLMQLKKGQLERTAEEKPNDAGFATVEESELGKQTVERKWTETELIAQCFVFFLAGFSTTSELLSFLSYELALNPNMQQRLYEEILDMNRTLNGNALTYEGVQKMKYLDMVISEGLRKWPPALVTERVCTRDCSLQFDGKTVEIKKGINVWIPIYALHHDEKYFPMPEKFDPERFGEQKKGSINLGAYLPFGIGPRNCIGSRFALMTAKAALYYLLLNFSLEVNEQTQIPLRIAKSSVGFSSEKGIHLEIKPRTY